MLSDRAFVKPNDAKTLDLADEQWRLIEDMLPLLQPLQNVTAPGPKKRAWRHGRAWKMKIRALKNHDPCFEFASKLTQLYRHKV